MGKTSKAAVVVNGPIEMILVPNKLAVIKHVQNTTLITMKVTETVFFMILVFYEVNKHSVDSRSTAYKTKRSSISQTPFLNSGGRGGIRTLDTDNRMPPFQGGTFNHSATLPRCLASSEN